MDNFMDIVEKIRLVERNTEEILNKEKIRELLKKKNPRVYCGYETSGEIHLGHLVTITKLLDLQKTGFHVVILFADWHTWLNRKGDWKFIHEQVKIWQNGFKAAGLKNAEFVLGSKFQRDLNYIDDILLMSLNTTINLAVRSMQQIARDLENAKVSQVIYPFMQIEDIKALKVDAVVAGIEQRKIHALGLELFKEINYESPLFIHTPLIPSLKGPGKMSSSEPESMISIRDKKEDIVKKINNAYCPVSVENNAVLSIARLIIFPRVKEFVIERNEKFGGNIKFDNYDKLEKEYLMSKIHPSDLKNNVSRYLVEIIEPIRKAFKK